MGKVFPLELVTRKEDLSVLKDGPFSIITGRNLKTSSEAEPKEPKAEK